MVITSTFLRIVPLMVVFLWTTNPRAENYIDLDIGVVYSDVSVSEPSPIDGNFDSGDAGYHLGVGAYRNNDDSRWVYGVKLELQDVVGSMLLSVRAIDLGYRVTPGLVLNGYLGAARYDLTTPAFGFRAGLGGHYWFSNRWALAAEASYGDTLARDKLVPEDNPGVGNPDIFFDIVQFSIYLKYKF